MADKVIVIDGVEYIRKDLVNTPNPNINVPEKLIPNTFCIPCDPQTGEMAYTPMTAEQLAAKSAALAAPYKGKSEAEIDAIIFGATGVRPVKAAEIIKGFGNGN